MAGRAAVPVGGDTGVGRVVEYRTPYGRIALADEVVATIAGTAAVQCPGVAGMVPRGLREGLAGLLGGEHHGRGVEVATSDSTVVVTVRIAVVYGVAIAEVARDVMGRVREAVARAIGDDNVRVNVYVAGVRLDDHIP